MLSPFSCVLHTPRVQPIVLRHMDLAEAVADAIIADNPDTAVEVSDEGGYIRIRAPEYCRLTRLSLERELGRSFPLVELEQDMIEMLRTRETFGDDAVHERIYDAIARRDEATAAAVTRDHLSSLATKLGS